MKDYPAIGERLYRRVLPNGLTVLVVPLGSFEKAGYLTLAISLTNFFFTVAYFGLRNFQVSDSAGKYSSSLYISTRILTCIAAFGLCVAFTLCNRQYSGEQMACIIISRPIMNT